MPIDYRKYPPDWKTRIRPDILRRANNRCEMCGAENGSYVMRPRIVTWRGNGLLDKRRGCVLMTFWPVRIVLTIAHMDHDVTNNDYSNLKALCQKCHLDLDRDQHRTNAAKTRTIKKKDKEQKNGQKFLNLE